MSPWFKKYVWEPLVAIGRVKAAIVALGWLGLWAFINQFQIPMSPAVSGLYVIGTAILACIGLVCTDLWLASRQKLRILFRYDMPWVQLNPGVQDPGHHIAHSGSLFTYRVAIINRGSDIAEKVTVEMVWIEPQIVTHRLVPCRLHFRHDNPPDSQSYAQEMDVAETHDLQYRDASFVDVFWFWDAPDKERMGIWSSVRGVDQEIPVNSYKFAIKVSSRNCGAPVTKEFQFIYKTEGVPTIEPEET
ncbi:MAG: hypothetical protein ACREIJ_01965 [Nitrospiraceae bacterium]